VLEGCVSEFLQVFFATPLPSFAGFFRDDGGASLMFPTDGLNRKVNAFALIGSGLDYFFISYHFKAMYYSHIPAEYRETAEALFPIEGFSPDTTAAAGFAEALGIGVEYQRLLGIKPNTEQMRVFLGHFQNNLDLLIQKTWVEKADKDRKEKLQDEVLPLITLIIQGNYQQAIKDLGSILEELAYLFFGTQSAKDDFTEYTFRIDIQMGLFWWYGSRLGSLKKTDAHDIHIDTNNESLWAVLLLGLCYLTNF
jgi:hypothetical protein